MSSRFGGLVSLLESSPIHERVTHQFIHVIIIGWRRPVSAEGLRFILDDVFMTGDRELASWVQTFSHHRPTVDLRTVATVEVPNKPIAVLDRQATMLRRNVAELELDIGFTPSADQESFLVNGIGSPPPQGVSCP